jgi:hypothetical protein
MNDIIINQDEEIVNGMHEDDLEVISLIKSPQIDDYFHSEQGQLLIEECKDIIVEKTFESRWSLIEGYHLLGERITKDDNFQKYAKTNQTSLQGLAQNLNIGERTLYYAIQFYEKYPDLSLLPEAKNTSWSQIVTKYLPERTQSKSNPLSRADLIKILREIKLLLEHEYLDANNRLINIHLLGDDDVYHDKDKVDYIRYLQDQIEKIIGDLKL